MAVGKLTLAVNRKWKDAQGQLKEEATFVDIECFGKQAETVGQYVKKGMPLLVEARLKTDVWEDKQTGKPRSKLVVVMEAMHFCGRPEQSATAAAPTRQAPASDDGPSEDGSVPF
jgi:single-strand DNA-binding protein